MRFQILGHAALWIEAAETTFLVDPWLFGSCYWRSWWHFPAAVPPPEPRPDYIFVSHHHFDHLHYPSLRRLAKECGPQTTVLIPEFAVDVMRKEIESVGFEQVVELPHGEIFDRIPDVRLASYQFGFDDSAFVLESGGHVLANLNDCKINGWAARRMRSDFGAPTFLFKSYSFASAFPNCYEFDSDGEGMSLTSSDYCATFLRAVEELDAEHAIPFASMVGFLHPDAIHCNEHLVTPGVAADFVCKAGRVAHALEPGEGWDSERGFLRRESSAYEDLPAGLRRLGEEVSPVIAESLARESGIRADYGAFERHLVAFARSLPPGAGRLLSRPIVFFVPSDTGTPYWVLDARRKCTERLDRLPAQWATLITIPEAVLRDAVEKNILNFVHISMRMHTRIAAGGLSTDLAFWGLLLVWEMGYFDWRQILRPRAARVFWRRRVELLQTAGQALASLTRGKGITEGMVDNLLVRDDEIPPPS